MSIKKDNISVTAIKYNSQDVNKVILDNKCVWCKAFIYTQGTLPTGVESLTCRRSSTDEPTASTGEISNNGTIYYDDKLYWAAAASAGYRITYIRGSNSPVIVSGDITGTIASELTLELISGTISQGTLPTGVASITCYRKAYNSSSFSEYTGSTIYYGDQFYWTATASTDYDDPRLTYNSDSKVYTWKGSQGGSITSVAASGLVAGSRKSFTISFGTTAGKALYGSWSKSSQTAYYGDKITVSDNSVTCYKWDATSTARWTVTVTASSDNAQYTYSAVTIAESGIDSVTAAATFTAWNTRTVNSYTVTFTTRSGQYGSWSTTSIPNVPYGTTISLNRNNNIVTVGSLGSSTFAYPSTTVQYTYAAPVYDYPTKVTGATTITAGSEKSERLYTIQWFDSDRITVLETDSNVAYNAVLTYNGATPSKSSTSEYTYTFSGWKLGSTSGSDVESGTTLNPGSTSSTTIKIYPTFTSTVRSYTITWKYLSAYPNIWTTETQTYKYGATPSKTVSNVASGKTRKAFVSWDSLAKVTEDRTITANYKTQFAPTINSNYCTATMQPFQSGPWYDSGTVITWTANDNYSFGGTTVKDTTNPQTITSGDATYSATPGYIKCTISSTNCKSAPATGSIIQVGKSITYTANSNYSYTEHATTPSNPPEHTVALGKTSYSRSCDYALITASGTNCSANVASGYRKIGNEITWTANTNYAFDSSGTKTASRVITGPGAYSVSPTHGHYDVKLTHCHYGPEGSGDQAGWYPLGTIPSTLVFADSGWSFDGVYTDDHITIGGSAEVPTTVSASPTYFEVYIDNGRACSANVSVGSHMFSTSNPTTVVWTAYERCAFDAFETYKIQETPSKPGTYKKAATHGYYDLDLTNCQYESGDRAGWYLLDTSPSTVVKADTGWSFNGSSQDTITVGGSHYVPITLSASPTYFYITFNPINCTSAGPTGISKYYTSSDMPLNVIWEPDYYYSFKAGKTQTSSEQSINVNKPTTFTASPQYVRAERIETGTYNASVDKNADTYYAKDTVVTWTAKTNYYYSAIGTTTSTNNNTKITAGASISAPNPTHIACNISGTNCTANKTSGTVLAVGDTITWTGNTGANSKYSFSNTNPNSTATATVALGTISYSKTASYLWYNVTSANGINCKAYTSDSYGTEFRTGWHLAGTKIYWKTTSTPYAMTTSNDTTLTVDVQAGNNNRIAMVKRYKLSISKMPNIASILAWRTASPYENAATGSSNHLINISNSGASITETATIYYGDSITMSARSASHYHFPGGDNSHTSITNTVNNVTGNAEWSPRVVINTYPVTIKAGSGVDSVFLSTNQNALSGSSSGTTFSYNSTVYGFVALNTAGYKEQSDWSYVGNGNIFRVGSKIVASTNDFGTVSASQLSGPCTINVSSNHNGLKSVYLSASSMAHFGSSSLRVTPGTTVYGFAVLGRNVSPNQVSGWTLISGSSCEYGAIYRVGSKTPYRVENITFTINLKW